MSWHFHPLKLRHSLLNLAKTLEIGKYEKVNIMDVFPAMSVACIRRLGFLYRLWKRKTLSSSDNLEYLSKSYLHLIFLAKICRLLWLWVIASKSEKICFFGNSCVQLNHQSI